MIALLWLLGCGPTVGSTVPTLCLETANLDVEVLSRWERARGDCQREARELSFIDGYLQGLDRAWSAARIAEGLDTPFPALAEPVVGAGVVRGGRCEVEGADATAVQRALAQTRIRVAERLRWCDTAR